MKILFTATLAALMLSANSQEVKPTSKGTFMLGGNASFSYNEDDFQTTTTAGIEPRIGYFIIDNLAIGITSSFQYAKYKTEFTVWKFDTPTKKLEICTKEYVLSPFVRYVSNLGVFGELQAGFGLINYQLIESETRKTIKITPSVGYSYFLNSKVAVEGAIYYNYQKYDPEPISSTYKSYGFKVGFQVYL